MGTEWLFVVPARGGSKRIPGKNLMPFRGRPLLAYTLDALADVCQSHPVVVSSDDDAILTFARRYESLLHHERPPSLALDDTPMPRAVLDVLDWYEAGYGTKIEYLVCLQPTSPLRTSSHVREFVGLATSAELPPLVSAHRMREHPMECVEVEPSGAWSFLRNPEGASRSQDYRGDFMFINGALYGARPDFLRQHGTFIVPGVTEFFVMDTSAGLDIDEMDDIRHFLP